MKISKILPVAALGIALSVGATQKAEAYAYAYSDLFVTNGIVTVGGFGGITQVPASASNASAQLNGTGAATGDTGNFANAPVAVGSGSQWVSGVPADNAFVSQGASTTKNYSWADSAILSHQTPIAGSYIETHQIAEGNVTAGNFAGGNSNTSSVTSVGFAIADVANTFTFDFDASLTMIAEITAPDTGIQAIATASIEITITNATTGAMVFFWSAGSADGFGVASAVNGFTFGNVSVDSTDYDDSINALAHFSVTSNTLAVGDYNLNLKAIAQQDVEASPIPTPGSIALLGLGLLLLSASRRNTPDSTKMAA